MREGSPHTQGAESHQKTGEEQAIKAKPRGQTCSEHHEESAEKAEEKEKVKEKIPHTGDTDQCG